MGKVKIDKRKLRLHDTIDKLPIEKVDYVQGMLDEILASIKEDEKRKNKKIDLSKFSGKVIFPKNFDAVKWQRKLRDEWPV